MSVMSNMALEKWERDLDGSDSLEEEDLPVEEDDPSTEAEDSSVDDVLASLRAMVSSEPKSEDAPAGQPEEPSSKPAPSDVEEDQRRKEHEEAEAKRKAEFDAKQAEKKAKEQAELKKIAEMSDEDVIRESVSQIAGQTEKLTRRNMKILVTEHVQEKCAADPAFARLTMNPKKDMVKCFRYITRLARKFIEDEMKANGETAQQGGFGGDVPDDVCYQWAIDYFNDPNAEEDKEQEEKFTPKPYTGKTGAKKPAKKPEKQKPAEKKAPPKKEEDSSQLSFGALEAAA